MKAVNFEQANIQLAKDQPEYQTLPIHADVDSNQQIIMEGDHPRDPMGEFTCCMELDKDELAEVAKTGKIWLTQLTFWKPFQPIRMSTQNPFTPQENLVDNYKASQGNNQS